MIVTVIGMGYVGLATGTCLAYFGNKVFCYDYDSSKIDKLKKGLLPVCEKGLKELIQIGTDAGLLTFTTDPASAFNHPDVIIIAVGTPPLETGKPDLRSIESAARQIGKTLEPGRFTVIINKSTVPVGTCNQLASIIQSETAACKKEYFAVVSNPEFLREGSAIFDTFYPSRIVLGSCDSQAIEITRTLYRPFIEQSFKDLPSIAPRPDGFNQVEVIVTTPVNAEMIKYASNAFLATKISFINDIANICERVGADVAVIARGMGLDPRIGKEFLKAGIGWGGSCFGKDIAALIHTAQSHYYHPELIDAVVRVNKKQRLAVITKLEEVIGNIKGCTVGLLGLSFKPGTNDIRDSPSIDIIKKLLEKGAFVKVYDPVAMENCREQHPDLAVLYENNITDLARGTDAVVIVTDWEEFRNADIDNIKAVMKRAVIIDGRNILEPEKLTEKGFIYRGIGR